MTRDSIPVDRLDVPVGDVLAKIDRDGYAVLEDAVDPDGLVAVRRELDAAIATHRLLPVLRGNPRPDDPKQLTPEECRRGDDYIRPRAFIAYVDDPMLTCPSALPYAFSDLVSSIAQGVYGCSAALTASKVMRSYANDLPLLELNWFHYDNQASRILKFFMYLDDVESGGGAFNYIAGSHRRKPRGLIAPSHLSNSDAAAFYGADALCELTGKRGSVVIADTAGYHRAGKPSLADRSVLLVATGVHRFHTDLRIRREYVERLSPRLRALADFAVLVDDDAAG